MVFGVIRTAQFRFKWQIVTVILQKPKIYIWYHGIAYLFLVASPPNRNVSSTTTFIKNESKQKEKSAGFNVGNFYENIS